MRNIDKLCADPWAASDVPSIEQPLFHIENAAPTTTIRKALPNVPA